MMSGYNQNRFFRSVQFRNYCPLVVDSSYFRGIDNDLLNDIAENFLNTFSGQILNAYLNLICTKFIITRFKISLGISGKLQPVGPRDPLSRPVPNFENEEIISLEDGVKCSYDIVIAIDLDCVNERETPYIKRLISMSISQNLNIHELNSSIISF